jgi:hypothetical protein
MLCVRSALARRALATVTVAAALVSGSSSFASAPGDAPGRLHNDAFWNRCGSPQGQPDIPMTQCVNATNTSFAGGCIDQQEHDYAVSHGIMVFCLGPTIVSACPCGCFEQGTRLLTAVAAQAATWTAVKDLTAADSVIAAAGGATLRDLALVPHAISYTTKGPERHDLFVFTSAGGKELALTGGHAVLLADGRMIAAKDVRMTDKLVAADGTAVTLTAIKRRATTTDVYNLLVESKADAEHLVVAEGLVVGDILWQNALGADLGKVLLRQ